MAGGAALQQAWAQDTDKPATTSSDSAPALSQDQMQAMANQKLADSQRAAYMLSSTPIQQYYNPTAQQTLPTQSQTLRVPGFQGVRNPFVSQAVAAQPLARTDQAASQVSNLLNQTNQYKQNYANQLYKAQQANQTQLAALQKAYQDNMAAKKAEAEAAAERQRQSSMFGMLSGFGSSNDGNNFAASGGIADLQRGFE